MIEDGPKTFAGIVRFLQYIKGPDHWHYVGDTGEPTFETSWENYGGATFQLARFVKDAAGVVHIEGMVKSGTVGAGEIFTLPPVYRPSLGIGFAVDTSDGPANGGRLEVYANGMVYPMAGGNGWFGITCSFYIG